MTPLVALHVSGGVATALYHFGILLNDRCRHSDKIASFQTATSPLNNLLISDLPD